MIIIIIREKAFREMKKRCRDDHCSKIETLNFFFFFFFLIMEFDYIQTNKQVQVMALRLERGGELGGDVAIYVR